MDRDNRVLDLKGLAGATGGTVAVMLAQLEGAGAGARGGAPQDNFWTRQFAASSKPGKIDS
jgi:hypothetical protein